MVGVLTRTRNWIVTKGFLSHWNRLYHNHGPGAAADKPIMSHSVLNMLNLLPFHHALHDPEHIPVLQRCLCKMYVKCSTGTLRCCVVSEKAFHITSQPSSLLSNMVASPSSSSSPPPTTICWWPCSRWASCASSALVMNASSRPRCAPRSACVLGSR